MLLFFSFFFSSTEKIRSLKSPELNGEQRQRAARCYMSGDGRFTGGGGKEEEEDEEEQEEDEEEVEEEEDAGCTTNPKTATSSCMVCWEIN